MIIGAGPAGLTAAYELLTRTDIRPIVLEKSTYMGGISRTIVHKGYRMDIGGHRFFSKSDRVMDWWLAHMPLEENGAYRVTYQRQSRSVSGIAGADLPRNPEAVMLVRPRKSRIYFLRKFFDYPIQLSWDTLSKLGLWRTVKIGFSYIRAALLPLKPETNLERFFINRFGRELYLTFFKSYTEKVWGVPCDEISAEWGKQRIKGLSILKTIAHYARKVFSGKRRDGDVAQKETETSLIEQFMYPKFGPGQMWEEVARKVTALGGTILTEFDVNRISVQGSHITSVTGKDASGATKTFTGDYFFSTMPIQELVRDLDTPVPREIRDISDGLLYRDFITVGLLVNKLKVKEDDDRTDALIRDNWIYIQEPDVLAGRLQIFNNWSPYLIADPSKVWVGVEYFCYETDELWKLGETAMSDLAATELDKIGIIDKKDVLDSTVVHMPKTYPAYFGAYAQFDKLQQYLDAFENLFLVGRNGMHKYNNQDHSMLTAMTAVDNILAGRTDKANIWAVNTEMEYHETKETTAAAQS